MIVNSLNPKTALFFLAFLPQFVDPDRGAVAPQVLALGVLFLVLATLSDSGYALVAGSVRGWLGERRRTLGASAAQRLGVGRARGVVAGVELERAGVDAVAQAARLAGAVVEHVAEVPAAGAAHDLGAAHEQRVVRPRLDGGGAAGSVKLGQPVPDSNLVSEGNSSAPSPHSGTRRRP